ncbi:hypothetical protein RS3R1_30960 [Pseudomonas atacamensis]|uniref:Uncharacterized protein n=1 Tax=Pseudomonas atacamensis TaxID=2565368 RepID=A0ABQ5PKK0_9PSED|nr:hypothetical protein RS3R1_30960 [Pseudomonas atacamensis]
MIGKGVIREDHAFFVIGGKKSAEGAKDQKPKQKPDQEPLTLALSRRERELTEVFNRSTPT